MKSPLISFYFIFSSLVTQSASTFMNTFRFITSWSARRKQSYSSILQVNISRQGFLQWLSSKESNLQETQVRYLGQEDPLGKEMATHSRILVWRIPWTEEPGGLQSMGWEKRVRHDIVIKRQ